MTGAGLLITAHATSALVCFGLGGYTLLRRVKGDAVHRTAGWCWVAGMVFVATSSFAIRDLGDGRLSFLHVLSAGTLIALLLGIRAARRHDVRRHRATMRGSYLGLLGALIGAVAVPARVIPTFVVTEPLGALAAAAAVAVTTVALIGLAHAISRRPPRAGRPRGVARGARRRGAVPSDSR